MAKRTFKVDMTGVESFTRCPEGEWLARLKKIEMGEVQGSGDDALKAQFEVIKGAAKGNTVFETFSLSEKALWKLKSFLEAIGVKSNGKLSLDLDKLEGKVCIIDVIHDEYNGVKRAKISNYIKPDDEDDEDDDDEDEEEEEVPAKKSKSAAPAKKSKKQPEPEEDEDEEDEDEDDDDEDEEEPPKKSKKTSKKPEKKSSKKSGKKSKKDEDEDEDDEDDEDEDDWEEDDD